MTVNRTDPKVGGVWRSKADPMRTVRVLEVPPTGVTGGRVRTETITSLWGLAPQRRTRTSVLLCNWHRTFEYWDGDQTKPVES
jgi:hypothetical protein